MNKSIQLVFFFVFASNVLLAQRFVETQTIELPDTVSVIQSEWVDLDNDGLLDILIIAENANGQYFLTYKNDTVAGFSFVKAQHTGFSEAIYLLVDYDGDNKMDVAVSGLKSTLPLTSILTNLGGFEFQEIPLGLEVQGSAMRFSDFNSDGKKELILSGENAQGPFLNFYRYTNNNWQIVNDSLKVKATDIQVFDFNGDIFPDIVVSGIDANGSSYLAIQYTDGNFNFKNTFVFPNAVNGTIEVADITNDGFFDLLIGGENDNGIYKTYRALNIEDAFTVSEISVQLDKPCLFVADIDIDGIVDNSLLGFLLSDTINIIQQSSSTSEELSHEGLKHQRFGDLEKDGDLDVLQITRKEKQNLRIFTNTTTTINRPPGASTFSVNTPVYDRQFIYWNKSADDHTNALSITYDIAIWSTASHVLMGEFDLEINKRLTVSHGNSGPANYSLLKLPNQEMEYSIQSIDNSFHVGEFTCKGKLGGGSGGGVPCEVAVAYTDMTFCNDEEVAIETSREVLWFSFADGYLGTSKDLSFVAEKSDTLFYFDRDSLCGFVQVFKVDVSDSLVRETFTTKYACLDDVVSFSVENTWDSVVWSSPLLGFISNATSIDFKVTEPDTLQAYLLNKPGCIEIRKTEVKISIPEVSVNGEVFQIMKGSSVQLEASGGETYSWSPSTNLSNSQISNPVATPPITTEYEVLVGDSLGCTVSKKVLVKVEQTAFIPSLFTPNQDGNNDHLKVYGLTTANGFNLKIYNREGNAVFETSDPLSAGWDGTKSGVEQPNGVYYWKVEGSYSNGAKLLLNGKTSGSVVLMR